MGAIPTLEYRRCVGCTISDAVYVARSADGSVVVLEGAELDGSLYCADCATTRVCRDCEGTNDVVDGLCIDCRRTNDAATPRTAA